MITWAAVGLMFVIQLFVPIRMIWQKESILTQGRFYKFEMAPVDPNDPLIGKYIVLNFRIQEHKMPSKLVPAGEKPVYVTFQVNQKGFAVIDSIMGTAPERKDYLKTEIYSREETGDGTIVYIEYPFRKFYMEESKAPEAEIFFQARSMDSSNKAYALVALYNGEASIKDVYINDTTITDMLRHQDNIRITTK